MLSFHFLTRAGLCLFPYFYITLISLISMGFMRVGIIVVVHVSSVVVETGDNQKPGSSSPSVLVV